METLFTVLGVLMVVGLVGLGLVVAFYATIIVGTLLMVAIAKLSELFKTRQSN